MGVYIKGMDKPKECYLCDVWSLCWNEKPYWSEREDCPLIEVKVPHGRLIDTDALEKARDKDFYGDVLSALQWDDECIAKAPTVIEAEVE